MNSRHKAVVFILLSVCGQLTEGYSHGAPPSTCIDMMPHHSGNSAMGVAPPYEIVINSKTMTYSPGQRFQVLVRPVSRPVVGVPRGPFKGFLIKAVGQSTGFAGSFENLPRGSQYLPCQSMGARSSKEAFTHTSDDTSSQMVFVWQAPTSNVGDIWIRATIVLSYNVFWTAIDSAHLQYQAPRPVSQPQPVPIQPQNPQQIPPQFPLQPGQLPALQPGQLPPQNQQSQQNPFSQQNLIPIQPQSPKQQSPPLQQHIPQFPQNLNQNVLPIRPGNQQNQPQRPIFQLHNPQQILPAQPQNGQSLPSLQPQQLPNLQAQHLPPFQPDQIHSPFQRPPAQQPPAQQPPLHPEHQPLPTLPMLRTLPAFTPFPADKSTTKAPLTTLQKDPLCGVSKGCHQACMADGCEHIVTWKDTNDYVEFELSAKTEFFGDQWIAIGLSDDLQMGNDEVIECVTSKGEVDVFHSFNIGKSNSRSTNDKIGLSNTEGSVVNGIMKCKFRRTKKIGRPSSQSDTLFDLEKDWYLMFGTGSAGSDYRIRMHSKNPMVTPIKIDFQSIIQRPSDLPNLLPEVPQQTTTTSSTASQTSQTPQDSKTLSQVKKCGETRGCYTADCTGSKCTYVVSWQDTPQHTDFEITAKMLYTGNQWTAIGFSEDQKMGDDEVVECVSSDDKVEVFRSFNEGKINKRFTMPKSGLENTEGSLKDGVFTCRFRRMKAIVRTKRSVEDNMVLDLDKNWHLMIGSGPSSTEFNKRMHTKNPLVSPKKVNFQSTDVIGGSAGYPLIKAHACLMIIAWILFTGVGIIAARYFKTVWVKHSFVGQKIWFQIHRTCMVLVLVFTVIGFVIIFIEAEGYSQIAKIPGKEYTQAHPILGIIVTMLCIANPIMSLFRCGPKDHNRPIFNWAHWAVGMLAHVLAIVTICFGIEMNKSPTPDYAVWVVVGYVVYHLLMELVLKIFDLYVDRPLENKNTALEMKSKNGYGTSENGSGPQPPTYAEVNKVQRKDPKDSTFKRMLFPVHVIFAVAFTLTLVLLVVMY